MSSLQRPLAGVLAAGAFALAAFAPQPVVISEAFVDRVPDVYKPRRGEVPVPACPVNVVRITDDRRAKDTIGVVAGRAVKAPADIDAWLKSVVSGLGARGFAVTFEPERASLPTEITATVSLRSVWLTAIETNKAGTVVLRVHAERPGRPAIDRDFRGALTNMNWASTRDELTNLTNAALAASLDQMAPDLRTLCGD